MVGWSTSWNAGWMRGSCHSSWGDGGWDASPVAAPLLLDGSSIDRRRRARPGRCLPTLGTDIPWIIPHFPDTASITSSSRHHGCTPLLLLHRCFPWLFFSSVRVSANSTTHPLPNTNGNDDLAIASNAPFLSSCRWPAQLDGVMRATTPLLAFYLLNLLTQV